MPGLIDVHHHVIAPVYEQAMFRLWGKTQIDGVDEVRWDPEMDLAVLDRHGIQTAVLSVTTPGVAFANGEQAALIARQVNEYLAELIAKRPTRYGALALVPLPDVSLALTEIDYALDTLGLDGVGLFTHYRGSYLGDPEFDRLFAVLAERGAVSFVHPAVPPATDQPGFGLPPSLYEFPFDTTRAVTNLLYSGTLDRYPELRLILSHAGGTVPYLAHRLTYAGTITASVAARQPRDLMASLRRLYYDTAMSANPHTLSALTSLIDSSQILFGSDFPYVPESVTAETVTGVRNYFAGQEREKIAHRNARALLPSLANRYTKADL